MLKRLFVAVFVTLLLGQPLWAAEQPRADEKGKPAKTMMVPEEYQMDASASQRTIGKGKSTEQLRQADYLNPDVPLNARERQAVKMAQDWETSGATPIQANGKLMFPYGASSPTVICAPSLISVVELQPGESLNEVVVGDSARWVCEVVKSGNTAHVLIKPMDAGLVTNAIITTDRRAYILKLVSQRTGHTPRVGFLYPEDNAIRLKEKDAKETKDKQWKTADADGEPKDLSQLNFSYEIKGDAPWKPIQVFDDGRQMFIKLPPSVQSGDAPVLLVRNGGQDTMANFRLKNMAMIVDGVFQEAFLISGVGSKQQRITIRKK